jgi:ribosome maturation factor RimP
MVFGLQVNQATGEPDEGEFHRSAFTTAILRADLEAAGFEVLRVEMRWTHSQETLQAVARKRSPE